MRIDCISDYREIKLTKGNTVKVSDIDYDEQNTYKWHSLTGGDGGKTYAARVIKKDNKRITLFMQDEIMKPSEGMMVDHINMNGLDNRRENLRVCCRSENNVNQHKYSNKRYSSKYKGVTWKKLNRKWEAKIRKNRITYN